MSRRLVDAIWIRQRMDRRDQAVADRLAFHARLAHPATGPRLDAALADAARIDAEQLAADIAAHEYARQLEDEDAFAGQACGPNCGFCGRCS
jgi:hypothetical protein